MEIKKRIKSSIEKLIGKPLYTSLPFGADPLKDVMRRFPLYKFQLIFDVGSNIGQSAMIYKKYFPDAQIYCFEPVTNTFQQLISNLKKIPGIKCFQVGFGDIKDSISMITGEHSDMNTLLSSREVIFTNGIQHREKIEIDTLTSFCNEHGIMHINYLKIDTEGYDLEVLKGAMLMLDSLAIDFIEVEAGMNPTNTLHIPFEEIKRFLENKNYFLYGIYEQVQEWKTQHPILRRCNPLFISKRMANL